jgi:hypothetical protein
MQFSPTAYYFFLFGPNTPLSTLSTNTFRNTVQSVTYIYFYFVNYSTEKRFKTKVADLAETLLYPECNLSVRSIIIFKGGVGNRFNSVLGHVSKVRLLFERYESKLN